MPSVAEIRAQAEEVAAGWSAPGSPESWRLTAALFRAIAADAGLLGRLAALPADRLPALLASAAISFLVRRDRPEPLAGYFPAPGGPQPPFDDGFYPAAHGFVAARLDDILATCQGRRYQMNEVARCAQIALGIAAACPGPDPVGLADLGTGAGFGLQLDRYRYQVGGRAAGTAAAALRLDCAARGPHQPPPAVLPPIADRAGLDLHPIDVRDPAARHWLQACAPPEASAQDRLAAAIEVTRQHPVPLLAGDVVDALPGLLDRFPPGQPLVVVDAYLAVFLPASGGPGWPPSWPKRAGPGRSPGCRSTRWSRSGRAAGIACRACRCQAGWSATTRGACSPCSARAPSTGAPIRGRCWPGRTRPASGWNGSVPASRNRRPRSAPPPRRPGPARPAGSGSAARPAAPGPAGSSTPGTAT